LEWGVDYVEDKVKLKGLCPVLLSRSMFAYVLFGAWSARAAASGRDSRGRVTDGSDEWFWWRERCRVRLLCLGRKNGGWNLNEGHKFWFRIEKSTREKNVFKAVFFIKIS